MTFYARPRRSFAPRKMIVKNEKIVSRIEKVLAEPGHNDRTIAFLTDILAFAQKRGGLTQAQLSYFEKIESAFTPEAKKAREAFQASLTEQDWEKWRIAINYYSHLETYYGEIVRASNDPSFVPTEKQFQKIVCNSYAQKIIEATLSKPKFELQSVVVLRKSAATRRRLLGSFGSNQKLSSFLDAPAIVIDNNVGPALEARKGSKRYSILPFGASNAIEVTESDIKKAKK